MRIPRYPLSCVPLALPVFFLAIAIANIADAQSAPTIVKGFPDGTYVATVTNGQLTITSATTVSPNGPVVPPVVPPVVTPTPSPDLSPNAKAIFDAVMQTNDPQRAGTAADLAAILQAFADKTSDGSKLRQGVPMLASMYLQSVGKSTSWSPVIQAISTRLAACDTGGDRCKILVGEIVDGLNAAAPDAKASIDIATIMMLVELIMKILDMFQAEPMAAMDAMGDLQKLLAEQAAKSTPLVVPAE